MPTTAIHASRILTPDEEIIDGVIIVEGSRVIALGQIFRIDPARHRAEEIVLRVGISRIRAVAAEPGEWPAREQRVAVELLVHQREHGADRTRKIGDQVRVVTPAEAVASGASYIVVGRPITEAADPAAEAKAILGQISG